MNPRDLIPTSEQIKLVRGVEADLLQRRRKGALGGIIAIVAAVSQIVLAAQQNNYAANLGKAVNALFAKDYQEVIGPNGLSGPQVVGILIIVAGLVIYFTYRWTSLLLQESKEPFQYTFWIEPFEVIKGTPDKRFALEADDRLQLLHHDLMERLSLNIRRLSLLNVEADVPKEAQNNLTSHIRVRGNYVIREVKDGRWVLHVMPVIRIGPAGRAEIVADPVKIDLREGGEESEKRLSAKTYNQLVQRIYSIVASQVYKQILSDVKTKSKLFPTDYLRAVAFYHEAVDFERSNTIDAYDSAIELYRKSKHHFETRTFGWLPRVLVKIPVVPLWKLAQASLLADARTRVGLARSLIYRRSVSALSGRNQNVLYEIPAELNRVISSLTALQYRITPRKWKLSRLSEQDRPGQEQVGVLGPPDLLDSTSRDQSGREKDSSATAASLDLGDVYSDPAAQQDYRSLMTFLTFRGGVSLKHSFDMQRSTLFDAYAVAALAHSYLQAPTAAREMLKRAKATNPILSQRSPIWFLATAEVEPDIDKKLLFLTQAAELDSKFEIAQYRLAQFSEMRLRRRGEIRKERVSGLIKQYEDVLTMNPGNIGALSAQGYLWWLLGDKEAAQRKLEEGCQNRAIVRQTFVGDLFYALARIAAENGQFNRCYDLYNQAILADPEVACASPVGSTKVLQSNYDYIDSSLQQRYERFYRRTSRAIQKLLELKESERFDRDNLAVSERALKSVRSFVLNDYGNACLSYFLRFGEPQKLRRAIEAYEAATGDNEENFVAYYNLNTAYTWTEGGSRGSRDLLENAEKMAPAWPALLIASVRSRVEHAQERIKKKKSELEVVEERLIKESAEVVDQVKRPRHSMEGEMYSPASESSASASGPSTPEASVTVAETKGPSVELSVMQQYKTSVLEMERLQKDLEVSRKTLKKRIFPQITSKTMSRTKWSSVLPGLQLDYDGHGVNELLEARIKIEGLDEDDLAALQVWATTLSTNTESESALVAAAKLCEYIETFYPESFETKQTLYSVYGSLENVGTPLLEMQNLKDAQGIMQKLRHSPEPHYQYLLSQLSDSSRDFEIYAKSLPPDALKRALVAELNRIIKETSLADQPSFKSLKKSLPTGRLGLRKPTNINRVRVNRQLLQLVFPTQLKIGKDIPDAVMELYQAKKADCGASLQRIINGWLEADPINFASLRWATDFTEIFNPKQRRSLLKNAIAIEPGNGSYYHLFGTLRDRRKFFKLAAQCHEVACKKTPKEHSYFHSLGVSYYLQKKYIEAARAYRRAGVLAPNEHSYQNSLGNSYYGAEKYDDAARSYQKAIDLSQGVAVYYSNLALALQNVQQWEKAIDAWTVAIKIDPQPSFKTQLATFHNLRANDYFGQGNFTAAIESYLKAIELEKKIGVYYFNISRAYDEAKDWENAIKACETALDIEPQNTSYYQQLANIHNLKGNQQFGLAEYAKAIDSYKKAIETMRKAKATSPIEIGSYTAVYHANLSRAFEELQDWERAIAACNEAISIDAQNASYPAQLANIYNSRGTDYFRNSNYVASKGDYEEAIRLNPTNALYHANLAASFGWLKDWQRAFAEVAEAQKLDPQDSITAQVLAGVHNSHGDDMSAGGDYALAKASYEKAIQLNSGTAAYYSRLAGALAGLQDFKQAIVECNKARTIEPWNQIYDGQLAGIYEGEGDAYFFRNDYEMAKTDYEEAIKLNPGSSQHHASLAEALSELKDWPRAIEQGKLALQIEPDNKNCRDILVGIYVAQGDDRLARGEYQPAIESYEAANALDDTNDVVHSQLARAWEALDESNSQVNARNRAISALRKAIELSPANNEYRERLKRLEGLLAKEVRGLR